MLFQGAKLSMQNWIIFDEKICSVIVLWANRRTRTIIYTFISKLFLVLKWVFFFSSYKMLKTLLVFWVSPSFFLHRINDSLRPLEAKRTRTAWAVFKYCGTKTVPLRMKKKLWKYWLKIYIKITIKKGVRIIYK